MKPPSGFFWILVARSNIQGIVRGPFLKKNTSQLHRVLLSTLGTQVQLVDTHLFFTTGKHTDDRKTNGLYTEGWSPIVCQDRKTYVTVAVDVRMNRNVPSHKYHLNKIQSKLDKRFIPHEIDLFLDNRSISHTEVS